jgi:hypothetical protein
VPNSKPDLHALTLSQCRRDAIFWRHFAAFIVLRPDVDRAGDRWAPLTMKNSCSSADSSRGAEI